jgi:hypothetical protein
MSVSNSGKWEKLSKLGRSQFVLRYGVLGWGIPTAILFALWQSYANGFDGFLFKLIPALILFPLGGILWGRFMWWFLTRMHAPSTTAGTKE